MKWRIKGRTTGGRIDKRTTSKDLLHFRHLLPFLYIGQSFSRSLHLELISQSIHRFRQNSALRFLHRVPYHYFLSPPLQRQHIFDFLFFQNTSTASSIIIFGTYSLTICSVISCVTSKCLLSSATSRKTTSVAPDFATCS